LSVLVTKETSELEVVVRFAEYAAEYLPTSGRKHGVRVWRRKPKQAHTERVKLTEVIDQRLRDARGLTLEGRVREVPPGMKLPPGTRAVALFLVNRRPPGDRGLHDEEMIFQVEMELTCAEGFVPRPNVAGENKADWDDKVADLQFRDRCEFAVGHNVATLTDPPASPDGPRTRVRTTWIPRVEVPRVKPHAEKGVTVAMEELGQLGDGADVERSLGRLPEAYAAWIAEQRARDVGPPESPRADTQARLMKLAEEACQRIRRGIALVAGDATARRAFVLANRAMAASARRRKPDDFKNGEQPQWRLFQLAFVLANLEGLVHEEHADRRRVELIFFPTGGGKTEAYLGVIAFVLVLRRLRRGKLPDAGLGVAVLLRYTLRLLTLDQLDRAAT
jgi:hypothetical protein